LQASFICVSTSQPIESAGLKRPISEERANSVVSAWQEYDAILFCVFWILSQPLGTRLSRLSFYVLASKRMPGGISPTGSLNSLFIACYQLFCFP
jgi:hypothetical protein